MKEILKADLKSLNITEDKLKQLKEVLPEVFTEGLKVDLDKLKIAIGESAETGRERFGMNWPGKADCIKIIQAPSVATLIPSKNESVNFDATENVFIEGDNLEVLKLLQKSYYGKVKMIYIDPPYNTGGDFIYPDNYSESLDTYLRYSGQIDNQGRKYSTNTESDGRFHSKWLNMMYPRIYLAKNLLQDNGVIFLSIDNNEQHRFRMLMDEIFGEENFIEVLIWRKKSGGGQQDDFFVTEHDYIICYAKNKDKFSLNEKKVSKSADDYKLYDKKNQKHYKQVKLSKWGSAALREDRPTMYFPLTNPDGKQTYPIAPDGRPGRWRYGRMRVKELVDSDSIDWEKRDDVWVPYEKQYIPDAGELSTLKERSIFYDLVENTEGANELTEIFGMKDVFQNPKPSDLICHLILLATQANTNDIVLDFFAGSCSTAHAVLNLNAIDQGNRRFMMIQLPEIIDEQPVYKKLGFKTIADIGKERLRRVFTKIRENGAELLNFKENSMDLGFKVLKLAQSNFKVWDGATDSKKDGVEKQLEMHVEHINPKSSQEDILFELLLKAGFELTTKIEKISLVGKTVYSIEGGLMFICLEKELTQEVIKAMAEKSPSRVICLDKGFSGNDQLKTNAVQIMKSKRVEDFRTV